MKQRVEMLKAMDVVVAYMNNENAYMSWIYLVPDRATEDDFISIAEDDEEFNDVCELFNKLVKRYACKSGYCFGRKTFGETEEN